MSEYTGTGISGGVFSGIVKVVHTDLDAKALTKEHVAVLTAPQREHLHLLKRAGAIVSEGGGLLGHIAKLTREDNTPFVGNIADAANLFKNGERITVDGTRGVITCES
jgi:pyruvate,water dikinase